MYIRFDNLVDKKIQSDIIIFDNKNTNDTKQILFKNLSKQRIYNNKIYYQTQYIK